MLDSYYSFEEDTGKGVLLTTSTNDFKYLVVCMGR